MGARSDAVAPKGGSARISRRASRDATPASAEGGHRGIRITVRAVVLLVIVAALGAASIYPVRLYFRQHDQLAQLQTQTDALRVTNADLQAQVSLLHDPAYLEQLARACLGMVRKGETAFVVIPDGHGDPKPVPCTAGAVP